MKITTLQMFIFWFANDLEGMDASSDLNIDMPIHNLWSSSLKRIPQTLVYTSLLRNPTQTLTNRLYIILGDFMLLYNSSFINSD